jgi:ABC-type Fe3+ transport system permease subunit
MEGAAEMALLVFFMMGIALWHFTVFLPDRFWQGIVGAFIGAVLGSIVFGMIVQEASGKDLGDTDLSTALIAVPGTAIGLAIVYFIGMRSEKRPG